MSEVKVCGYCGSIRSHTAKCDHMQRLTGMRPRQMTTDEREAMQRAFWDSVVVLDDGFQSNGPCSGEKP